jgi:Tfp pilus assembly protein PilN
MDAWTIGLFAVAAFVAITALVRLMLVRRDRLLAELSAKARDEQHKKQLAEAQQKKKKEKKQVA